MLFCNTSSEVMLYWIYDTTCTVYAVRSEVAVYTGLDYILNGPSHHLRTMPVTLLVWCSKSYPLQWLDSKQRKISCLPTSLYTLSKGVNCSLVFVGNVLPGSESSVDVFVALHFYYLQIHQGLACSYGLTQDHVCWVIMDATIFFYLA